jgi:hypothetical protein
MFNALTGKPFGRPHDWSPSLRASTNLICASGNGDDVVGLPTLPVNFSGSLPPVVISMYPSNSVEPIDIRTDATVAYSRLKHFFSTRSADLGAVTSFAQAETYNAQYGDGMTPDEASAVGAAYETSTMWPFNPLTPYGVWEDTIQWPSAPVFDPCNNYVIPNPVHPPYPRYACFAIRSRMSCNSN